MLERLKQLLELLDHDDLTNINDFSDVLEELGLVPMDYPEDIRDAVESAIDDMEDYDVEEE